MGNQEFWIRKLVPSSKAKEFIRKSNIIKEKHDDIVHKKEHYSAL